MLATKEHKGRKTLDCFPCLLSTCRPVLPAHGAVVSCTSSRAIKGTSKMSKAPSSLRKTINVRPVGDKAAKSTWGTTKAFSLTRNTVNGRKGVACNSCFNSAAFMRSICHAVPPLARAASERFNALEPA